jgi:hypothetical protein
MIQFASNDNGFLQRWKAFQSLYWVETTLSALFSKAVHHVGIYTFWQNLSTENFYQVRPIWKYPAFWKAEMSGFHGLGTIRICGLHLP